MSAPSSNFLGRIHGPAIELVGWVWSAVASGFFMAHSHPKRGYAVLFCLFVYLLAREVPRVFSFLKGFAEVPAWPEFVALAVAALIAGHVGGSPAIAVIAGIATTADGRLFDSLY